MANLQYVFSKKFDETYTLGFVNGAQAVTESVKFKTDVITSINNIKTFSDEIEGETDNVYFSKYFKYKNGETWSEKLPISQITGITISHCQDFELELYYYRVVDGNYDTTLYVDNIIMTGDYTLNEYDSEAIIQGQGDIAILAPNDIYKIFKLEDFQAISSHSNYDIYYRFSQDDKRTFTPWEKLTKENISSVKISPIRFAVVEYTIKNLDSSPLVIYDVILIGDFQNVSANYIKTNRYGLKEDCITSFQNTPGTVGSNNTNANFYTGCLSSYSSSSDVIASLENNGCRKAGLENMWNPYASTQITALANKLANDISNQLGWTVEYHLTDPDGNGIDKNLFEYTLKNIIDVQRLKVVVPENKFPGETLIINQFNLDLFDTFEVHITKDAFKEAFGITKRPSQDDIIYICEANMLYYIKHSQAFKSVMNASTYYKVILEKYEEKSNIRNLNAESQQKIDMLTNNTTIDELFGDDMLLQEEQIANKEQTYPTVFDKIRYKIATKVKYIKEIFGTSEFNDIVHSYYDLSEVKIGTEAINYTKLDQTLNKGENRSFIVWFKFKNDYDENNALTTKVFNNYSVKSGIEFNLINNYNNTDKLGYKLFYQGDKLAFMLNDKSWRLDEKLLTNVWYVAVINLNQRQELLDMYIYKRDADIEISLFNKQTYEKATIYSTDTTGITSLISEGYRPVNNEEINIGSDFELVNNISYTIATSEYNHSENLILNASNIYYTNLRILNEVIPNEHIDNILKENILRDEQHIILADNATKKLITTVYYNRNWV